MNEVRIRGTLKFAPRTFSAGVSLVVQPDGEQAGVDCTAWSSDAPEAVEALSACGIGSHVTILGKLGRGKDKMLAKTDGSGGDVWTMRVSVVKVRVDAKVAAEAPPDIGTGGQIPF